MSNLKFWMVLFSCLGIWFVASPCHAERRVLLIGINQYAPPESAKTEDSCDRNWTNLKGAVNDIESMAKIITMRCDVPEENILMLKNEQAGREDILSAIRDHLITPTNPGDELLFYFCGHGSRVPSDDPDEVDAMDETIVPADAWQCAPDILDAELGWLFNDIIDKGGKLTALFDSCHSGSITRGGPMLTTGTRSLGSPVSPVALDRPEVPIDDRLPPARRGALIVSAAQNFQSAIEAFDPNGEIHGAFTSALISALRESSGNPSASELFGGVRARLKFFKISQEPHLDTIGSRLEDAWFGPGGKAKAKGLFISVLGRDKDEKVALGEGLGLGLSPGCVLESRQSSANYRLEIVDVPDLVSSQAVIIEGAIEDVKSGQFVEVVHWEPISGRRFWIPESADLSLQATVNQVYDQVKGNGMKWLEPGHLETTPTAIIFWQNQSWQLFLKGESNLDLGRDPSWAEVLGNAKTEHQIQGVMMLLPPGEDLRQEIMAAHVGSYLTETPEMAQYFLARWFDGQDENLMWVSSRSSSGELGKNLGSPMPVRTVSVVDKRGVGIVARGLVQQIRDLDRVYQWFLMKEPLDSRGFPYQLAVRKNESLELVEDGKLDPGIEYNIVMKLASEYEGQDCPERWIYIFSVNSQGKIKLAFPSGYTNENNRFPRLGVDGGLLDEVALEVPSFHGEPPWGRRSFILLTSRKPLDTNTLQQLERPFKARSRFRRSQWSVGWCSYFCGP